MAKLKVMNSTMGSQPGKGRAGREARETHFRYRRVDDALGPEFIEQALADLVGALVLPNLLADQEHIGVAPHFLAHGVAQSLAHRHRHHFGAGGNVRIGWLPAMTEWAPRRLQRSPGRSIGCLVGRWWLAA